MEPAAHRHSADAAPIDWSRAPLEALLVHLVDRHHAFTRECLARIDRLLPAVRDAHGAKHPELHEVAELHRALRDELSVHLLKEERVLFPYVTVLAHAAEHDGPAPRPPFGTIENPIRMMNHEHDAALTILADLHARTSSLAIPEDACASYRALYEALGELDRDLREHVHLETDILFPRAAELERRLAR